MKKPFCNFVLMQMPDTQKKLTVTELIRKNIIDIAIHQLGLANYLSYMNHKLIMNNNYLITYITSNISLT